MDPNECEEGSGAVGGLTVMVKIDRRMHQIIQEYDKCSTALKQFYDVIIRVFKEEYQEDERRQMLEKYDTWSRALKQFYDVIIRDFKVEYQEDERRQMLEVEQSIELTDEEKKMKYLQGLQEQVEQRIELTDEEKKMKYLHGLQEQVEKVQSLTYDAKRNTTREEKYLHFVHELPKKEEMDKRKILSLKLQVTILERRLDHEQRTNATLKTQVRKYMRNCEHDLTQYAAARKLLVCLRSDENTANERYPIQESVGDNSQQIPDDRYPAIPGSNLHDSRLSRAHSSNSSLTSECSVMVTEQQPAMGTLQAAATGPAQQPHIGNDDDPPKDFGEVEPSNGFKVMLGGNPQKPPTYIGNFRDIIMERALDINPDDVADKAFEVDLFSEDDLFDVMEKESPDDKRAVILGILDKKKLGTWEQEFDTLLNDIEAAA